MKSIRHLIGKVTLLSTMTLACLFAGRGYAFAQVDTVLVTAGDSIEVVSPQ